jgi:hypothetical protein
MDTYTHAQIAREKAEEKSRWHLRNRIENAVRNLRQRASQLDRDDHLEEMVLVRRSVLVVAHEAVKLARDISVEAGHMNAGQMFEDASARINWAITGADRNDHEIDFDSHPMGDGISNAEHDQRAREAAHAASHS